MENSYDRVPYFTYPYPDTHPIRAQAVARIYGLEAPAVETARVLEVGCAGGGNLIPMAYAFPDARFVGIDLSARQIEDAVRVAADLGLTNVEFRAMSVADVGPDLGRFDYVVSHGIYSWVPPAVQAHVLRVSSEHLSPTGVAFVSFNTYPGWHSRRWTRDVMLYHAARFADEAERVREAKGFLEAVSRSPTVGSVAATLLRSELDTLKGRPDHYVLHEHLEEHNEPLYFHEFAGRAAAAGLQYLGDARINGTLAEEQVPDVRRALDAARGDLVRTEQYADFFRNQAFRRALLCHADVRLDRGDPGERVRGMAAAAAVRPPAGGWAARPAGPVRYATARNHNVTTPDPTIAAVMAALGEAYPAAVPFARLGEAVARTLGLPAAEAEGRLTKALPWCWALNAVDLYVRPPAFATTVGRRPLASAVARHQVRVGTDLLTTLRHESANLDASLRRLLVTADGTRTVEDIVDLALADGWGGPGKTRQEVDTWIRKGLAGMALLALMVE